MASNATSKPLMTVDNDRFDRYNLVWLDANVGHGYNKRVLTKLKKIGPAVTCFVDKQECIDYIKQQDVRGIMCNIIFIVSGALSEVVIPTIENYDSVLLIFIFCGNVDNWKHLRYDKLRDIFSECEALINSIEMCIERNDATTDFSVMPDQHSALPGKL